MTDATTNVRNEALANVLSEANQAITDAKDFLHANGINYNLSEWVTVKKYAELHQLESTNVISNWIARGIIKESDIRVFPELNNLRLIRNVDYKE